MKCMPLSEKWVITLSTQYGCPMKCNFCDVPNVDFKGNASKEDLYQQLYKAIELFPDVHYTDRLNIHFARMGEPIFNNDVFDFTMMLHDDKHYFQNATDLRVEVIHPVLTTSLPRKLKSLKERILRWCFIKNTVYSGQAGFQFSINSTDEDQRTEMFGDMQLHLADLANIACKMPLPLGRKYCLNFAYCSDYIIDGDYLKYLFDPNMFMCKITPIHNNNACRDNNIQTIGGYDSFTPYKKAEESLLNAGYDVLTFIPSMDEEDGLVTCGNAILGGSKIKLKY